MRNDELSTTDLVVPELDSGSELIQVAIRPAARDHLLAWDASQRVVAIHESGHAVASAAAPTKNSGSSNRHNPPPWRVHGARRFIRGHFASLGHEGTNA